MARRTFLACVLAVAALTLLAGCPSRAPEPSRPPAPTTTAVSPGTACSPAGARGTLPDGRAAQCNLDGRWSVL
jgi:hypothetical protein